MSLARRSGAALLGLFALGCGGTQRIDTPMIRPVGEDLLALVPSGAELIVDVDLEQLRGWGSTSRILELLPAELRARLGELGFDADGDADALVIAAAGLGSPSPETVTVVRGRLDLDRARARLGTPGSEADYRGLTLYDGPAGALARISPRLWAFGSRVDIRRVVDLSRDGGESVRSADHALLDAYARAPTARLGRPALLAALVPTEVLREQLRKQGLPGADPDWYALSLAFGDGFDAVLVAGVRGQPEARALADRMRASVKEWSARPLARLLGVRPILEGVVVRPRESEVRLACRFPGTGVAGVLERLAALPRGSHE